MRWSERQRAMLEEMGIRVWAPRDADGGHAGAAVVAPPAPELKQTPPGAPAASTLAQATGPAAGRAPAPAPESAPTAAQELAPADWLFVGEPFDAGGDAAAAADLERLLDNMLAAIRVSRQGRGRDGRAAHLPLPDGVETDLDAAIARVAPRGIVALGRGAASAVLGVDEPLGRLRDRVHERGGLPVVVTFSLSYLLRHSADKAKAWADLCRAVAAVG